jgi:putative ABC transport system permease protein
MFWYYLVLGARGLTRNPLVTALIVLLIAVGVAGSITTFMMLRAVSANPLPSKSAHLFVPQIDNRGPQHRVTNSGDPDSELTFRDETALRNRHAGTHQTAIYPLGLSAVPVETAIRPFAAKGYAVNADFFGMFAAPFLYGGPWNTDADRLGANEVVIGRELNGKVFHGANSIGKELALGGRIYRVAGVLDDWNPVPRFYAISAVQAYSPPAQIFLPFQRAIDLQIPSMGGTLCAYNYTGSGWADLLGSECTWISYWIEFSTAADVQQFRAFLTAYAGEQRAQGRFDWPANVQVYDLSQWLAYMHVVPPEARISFAVALALLLVCTVNTVGLLLARFMRRAPDIGVRRALGASQRAIYTQYLIEAGIVGLTGGLLGVFLTALCMRCLDWVFEAKIARLVHADPIILGSAILLALAVALVAATYPVWRASRIQAAWQLKTG